MQQFGADLFDWLQQKQHATIRDNCV